MYNQRLYARVIFRKTGLLRFLGHLDVHRSFDRAIRRAKLPVEYSHGFSPHSLISFAMPLPVGVAGENELCAIDITGQWDPMAIYKALSRQLPAELGIVGVQVLARPKRSPFADLQLADYRAEICNIEPEKLQEAIEVLLQQDELIIHRQTKSKELDLNLRPRIYGLQVRNSNVLMRLGLTTEDLAKPDEVLWLLRQQLGEELQVRCLTRTAFWDLGQTPAEL